MAREKSMQQGIIIDASNAAVGRISTFAARQALLGMHVFIVNSGNAVITGNKRDILERYSARRARGRGNQKGPYFPSKPEAMLRRAIRGMLPFDRTRGREAFKRVKCYDSVPAELESAEKLKMPSKTGKSLKLKEVSNLM